MNKLIGKLILRFKIFYALYWLHIRWRMAWWPEWSELKSWDRMKRIREFAEKRFPNRGDIIHKLDASSLMLDLNFFPLRLLNYPWGISVVLSDWGKWWNNINLCFGRLFTVAIRWGEGRRQYVAVRFWLNRLSDFQVRFTPAPNFQKRFLARYEFTHEILELGNNPKDRVSKWWWGSEIFSDSVKWSGRKPLYRRLGKLFYRRDKTGKLIGYFGTELSAERKEELFYEHIQEKRVGQCGYELVGKGWDGTLYKDAIFGHTRDVLREVFPIRCTQCHSWHNPFVDDFPEWLKCERCRGEEYEVATETTSAIAA